LLRAEACGAGSRFESRAGFFIALGVQKGLEDEDGCDLVDQGLVLLAGLAGSVEDFMGGAAGQPLVPQVQRQTGEDGQFLGKGSRLFSLRAGFAGKVQRMAGDDACALELAAEPGQGSQIVFGVAFAGEGEYRLGGQPQLIGDGNADAPGPDVEAEISLRCARYGCGLQRCSSSGQSIS
jgi:hypothetical protein